MKSHRGSVLHMYEGAIQSALMEIFIKGMKRKISEDSDHIKPVNSLVVNYILNHIEYEWVIPDTDPCRKRKLFMTADYICVMYGYSMWGYERFWVYFRRLVDGIHIGKYESR